MHLKIIQTITTVMQVRIFTKLVMIGMALKCMKSASFFEDTAFDLSDDFLPKYNLYLHFVSIVSVSGCAA